MTLPPLHCSPILKNKVWGGRNLGTFLGKTSPEGNVGESWELSGYGSDMSVVADGPFAGKTILELAQSHHDQLLGRSTEGDTLPLLYKFIDANDHLSVQVHPTDRQAVENKWDLRGKTECWYIVHAQPGAQIIVGFRAGVTLSAVERGVADGSLESLLNHIPIAAGDCLHIPAGTVHAIMKGTLLYEIQETSDITLRLYDWGRLENGKPRALHVKESLQVLDTAWHDSHKAAPVPRESGTGSVRRRLRASCEYFVLEDYVFESAARVAVAPKGTFQVVTVVRGQAQLSCSTGTRPVPLGETVLVPAEARDIALSAEGGTVALVSSVA